MLTEVDVLVQELRVEELRREAEQERLVARLSANHNPGRASTRARDGVQEHGRRLRAGLHSINGMRRRPPRLARRGVRAF